MKLVPRIFAVTLVLICGPLAQAETYDLIVRHGRVVDGTGNPAYFADVAVTNGHIAAIGRIDGDAKREIDAKGLIVAPGFIDVHTHADEVAEMPYAENFIRMGVTTIVVGNCGASELNIGNLFKNIEATNAALNVASLIGHGTVRGKAMGGSFMRPPTPQELDKMEGYVDQAMRDGAVGLSTGLIYLPGTFAKTEEIIELAKVASKYDGIYASHMRDEGTGIYKSLNELFRIAREAHIRAEVSHIKLSGNSVWGQTEKVIAAIENARAEGLDITQDEYSYDASSTGMSQLVPDTAREGGHEKFRERIKDPEQKSAIIAKMKASLKEHGRDNYSYAFIAEYKHDRSLQGLDITEAAKAKRGSDSLDDQIEMILEIESNGGASGVFHGINEKDLQIFMSQPNTMIACDSGLREFGKGVPHPRGYGNNPRVLARYVRETHTLKLEDAIRKMTTLPAQTFQFKDRGQLREGNWADLTIFDPEKVQDNATYKEPHHYPSGIPFVIVNGVAVIKNGELTGERPGKALRHTPSIQ
ncbi:N-acyl-D-amino-acid deacylase family protein [Pedosphaera parvula]|uniref:D-aminoacylase domain protein n=1 Tax=Pedosphaera parvula (strain Ellin514) TaxID=320771 RepID=B9XQK2_PEDPL|nr:D-aminoacylase [Pedosphaera parvula]EEF57852.1 D-aminoacylase domain protein [Pedosphaera parvula Ellin514]